MLLLLLLPLPLTQAGGRGSGGNQTSMLSLSLSAALSGCASVLGSSRNRHGLLDSSTALYAQAQSNLRASNAFTLRFHVQASCQASKLRVLRRCSQVLIQLNCLYLVTCSQLERSPPMHNSTHLAFFTSFTIDRFRYPINDIASMDAWTHSRRRQTSR